MKVIKKPIPLYEDYIAYSDGSVYSNKSNKFLTPTKINKGMYAGKLNQNEVTIHF